MNSIEKLKNIFRDFPTVGPKTAGRFVYYLLKLPKSRVDELILAIQELASKVKLCKFCFNPFEIDDDFCEICKNPGRNRNLLCIVEKEADLLSLENTKKYTGLYFILGGTVAMMRKEDIDRLRIEELKKRIADNNFSEVIVALNPTPEGRATSILVESVIKEINKSPTLKITHLAKGIPVGGELEYADEETLQSALEGRK
ncbi:MAG: recombination mediator RecR [Candidatus Staskawiczbacteria bacterium]|nr:recombination mediator RecR [Candidatus Staskawiczbacteria bacterium]